MQSFVKPRQSLYILREVDPPTAPILSGSGNFAGVLPSSDGLGAHTDQARGLSYRHPSVFLHFTLPCTLHWLSVPTPPKHGHIGPDFDGLPQATDVPLADALFFKLRLQRQLPTRQALAKTSPLTERRQ